jgi:hypothetical protein
MRARAETHQPRLNTPINQVPLFEPGSMSFAHLSQRT